ncbi:MAG: dipeptidase [Verrucomicrobiota bacterium]|nr:dipeptidase [Verrucomicrobiota bacterium]
MQVVLDYLRQHSSAYVEELCEYLRFPSISAQPDKSPEMRQCASWLQKRFEKAGLQAKLMETGGCPVVLAKTPRSGKARPHYLVYGHYDVQPPEPFELWKTPPFAPRLEGRNLFARGASDNKGQHLAHLYAVEAYLKTGTDLPCDLTFLIEGEEEVGSKNLAKFLKQNRAILKGEGVVISDTGMPSLKQPALTCGLRGIAAFEVKVHGPNRDLHSGIFGGTVDNPAFVLSQILATLRDKKGRIAIPGFYDDVQPLTASERKEIAKLKLDPVKYRNFLGVQELFGEKGYTLVEQRSARPTLEINGLTSGYQGAGSKTIIPAWASAKITCRLVPNQDPARIGKLVAAYLKCLCPATCRIEVEVGHAGEPYYVSPENPKARAGINALRRAFKAEPIMMREGGSIPIVNDFRKILGVDTLLLGLALPDDNAHSPNEKFNLDSFEKGMAMAVFLWQELAAIGSSSKIK